MRGNGTQENPYIPTAWDEFVYAVGTEDAYVVMPEGTVYNCNEIAPNGMPIININCTMLNGNGLKILKPYNLRFNIRSDRNPLTVRNIHVNDFYQDNSSWSMFDLQDDEYSYIDIYDSTFSGMAVRSNSYSKTLKLIGKENGGNYRNQSMTRCSVNVALMGDMDSVGLGYNNYFCNVTVKLGETADVNNNWYGGISSRLENSFVRFTGASLLEEYPTTNYARYGGISNSIIVWTNSKGMVGGVGNQRQINCTWDDLKSSAYLRSIGFPIAGD